MQRRIPLKLLATAGLALAVALWPYVAPPAGGQEIASTTIGHTQAGRPMIVYHVGEGQKRVFILGGQHGGPEANTVRLTAMLLDHFTAAPEELSPGIGLDIMLEGNPDGLAAGSRQYLSGVDPNRNWGGTGWSPDAYDSNGRFRPGLGGPEPFSDPETSALADWLIETRPVFVVNYHSAGGFLFGPRDGPAGELADAYAGASGYLRAGGGTPSPLSYRASGTINAWLRQVDIPGLLIELSTPSAVEFDRNLAGLRAVLERLAAEVAAEHSE